MDLPLLQALVDAYGPSGREGPVREVVAAHRPPGYAAETDAKGNLLMRRVGAEGPVRVVVTAHLDEIAMIVRAVEPDGRVRLGALGGLYPWKLGEGPIVLLGSAEEVPAVMGFGGIHTEDPAAASVKARTAAVGWPEVRGITGRSAEDLARAGVRPGTRAVVARHRRRVWEMGDLLAAPFLDDRADLFAMLDLMARTDRPDVLFAATAAEEVGGEGALWLLGRLRPEVCLALELGPDVPDAPADLVPDPTVWASDGYALTAAEDLDLLARLSPGSAFQAMSRGGSDASCAASHGLVARPFTLGLPMANSHGFEVMHRDAPARLAEVSARLLEALA